MNNKKIIGVSITLAIMVSAMSGCSCSNQSELHKMIERGDSITIEVVEPAFEEQGEETTIEWVELASLKTYSDFRTAFENALGITTTDGLKSGVAYINLSNQADQNNTLYNALSNKQFTTSFNEESKHNQLVDAVSNNYADIDIESEDEVNAAILNAYFNLIADNTPNYFNGQSPLTREEAMTFMFKATTPVDQGLLTSKAVTDFETVTGSTELSAFASNLNEKAYLNTSDKSLNNKTITGTMTKAEYIYLLVNTVYGKETVEKTDLSTVKFNDCKELKTSSEAKDYQTQYDLASAVANPDNGIPTPLYKAVAFANSKGLIGNTTSWDEAITKTEAITLFVELMELKNNENGYTVDNTQGEVNTEEIRVIASESYKTQADKLDISAETYISEYIRMTEEGRSAEEIEEALYSMYKKETETQKPTEVAPEYRETVGTYTDETVGYHIKRTWENGAIRYYYYYQQLDKYYKATEYEFNKLIIPDEAKEAIEKYEAQQQQEQQATQKPQETEKPTETQAEKPTEQQTTSYDTDWGATPPRKPVGGSGDYDPDRDRGNVSIGN